MKYTILEKALVERALVDESAAVFFFQRVSRRRLRLPGRRLSTRRTSSAAAMSRAREISRIAVSDGLYLPLSRREIYFGWYPLSNASVSCVIPRSSRRVMRTRANARFSKYPRSSVLTNRVIDNGIVTQHSICYHTVYYPTDKRLVVSRASAVVVGHSAADRTKDAFVANLGSLR
jgi:hypothetical protein